MAENYIAQACDYIKEFWREIFETDEEGIIDDIENLPIYHSDVDDEENDDYGIGLQVYVNLKEMHLERYLDDVLVDKTEYKTKEDFLWAMENLEMYTLRDFSAEQFELYRKKTYSKSVTDQKGGI